VKQIGSSKKRYLLQVSSANSILNAMGTYNRFPYTENDCFSATCTVQ